MANSIASNPVSDDTPTDTQQSVIPASDEVKKPSASITGLTSNPARFLLELPKQLGVFIGQNGIVYAIITDAGNLYAIAVGSRKLDNIIRATALDGGHGHLRKKDLYEINESLMAYAEMAGIVRNVYFRVAPFEGGIEIDVGDDKHTRVRIKAGKVEIIAEGSETLFFRTQSFLPMALPAEEGDIKILKKYLNLHPKAVVLFIGWLSYSLAHPKAPTSKFVILILQGGQGSGKSILCRLIKAIIDPNVVSLQHMPTNAKDLAIATQNAHVLCFDNVRVFRQAMADLLCIAATGGSITSRQLYTDAEQHVLQLHVALVLNGIHSFIDQPDLAQRSLPIELLPLKDAARKSEAELVREFEADLPAIMHGLFDLIANIFKHLPDAEVTYPERMYDFVQWLAAMEKVDGIPAGIFQAAYSEALEQGQLDSLLDDVLAATVVEFAETVVDVEWAGTPAELLVELNKLVQASTQRSREWPQNPISLSKRIRPLQASLLTQGIHLGFTRGKQRTITIRFQDEK
jgi:hypothetical protein